MRIDKSIVLLCVIFALSVGAMLWHISSLQSNLLRENALDTAKKITIVLREVRDLYTSEVVETAIEHGIIVSHDTDRNLNSIPLPATFSMRLGKRIGQHSGGAKSKLYSPYPFPWRVDTGGLNDLFSKDAWKALGSDKNEPYARFVQTDTGESLRYAIADLMGPSCIRCHNSHPDSPKIDWKIGDLRGVIEVTVPLTSLATKATRQTRETAFIYSALGLLLLIGLAITLHRFQTSNKSLAKRQIDLEVSNNQLKELSELDSLTGIYNRRYYDRQIGTDISNARRTSTSVSMLLVDVDHFKEYNDHYGHDQGDRALQDVAAVIRGSTPRESDWVARFGGEEFVVVLPSTDLLGANYVGECIRTKVEKLALEHRRSASANVITVSVGMSSGKGLNLNAIDLFQHADMALYKAKTNGRNQCKSFEST